MWQILMVISGVIGVTMVVYDSKGTGVFFLGIAVFSLITYFNNAKEVKESLPKHNIPDNILKEQFDKVIDKILNGEISDLLEIPTDILLKKDERMILSR
jgi:hypothetical protein